MITIKTAWVNVISVFFILIYICLSYFTVEYLQDSYAREHEGEERQLLSQRLALIRSQIEADVNTDIYLADSLATLVTFAPNSTFAQWELVATQLVKKGKYIQSIGMAPNDVISFIYPLKGNERALGLDFRALPEQWNIIALARRTQQIVISNPVDLVQGGKGVIGRMPLYFDPPFNDEYWGHCSIVIDIESLLKGAGVYDLPSNIRIAMRAVDVNGKVGSVFLGSESVFHKPLVVERVQLISNSWLIALDIDNDVLQLNGSDIWQHNSVRIVGYLVAILVLLCFIATFKAYRVAHNIALQDVLTSLPNRRYAMLVLEQLVTTHAGGGTFSIINIDLNKFKQINDTHGHGIGDAFLIEVSKRLRTALRASDVVARLSGDEFLIILPRVGTDDEIANVIDKLLLQVCKTPFYYQSLVLEISLSLGVAKFPVDADNIPDLLHIADQAMYEDKLAHKHKPRD